MPRRDLKRPYNHPLSTGACNCLASEEESLDEPLRVELRICLEMGTR